jgi:hypothetical protein
VRRVSVRATQAFAIFDSACVDLDADALSPDAESLMPPSNLAREALARAVLYVKATVLRERGDGAPAAP